MIAAASPEIDVEKLMARIREEVARRKQQLGNPATGAPPPADEQPAPLSPGLGELLRREGDEVFVTHAYRALLRREPDPDGLQSCLASLENGTATRIDILRAICHSEEGGNVRAEVRGLTEPYTLGELLGGNDPTFLANAYRVLLGREPDENGLQTYLACLGECSLSRIDILRVLRFSAEGRALDVEVAGLLPPVAEASPVPDHRKAASQGQEPDWKPLPALDDDAMDAPIATKPGYELGELLGYPDEVFVRNAYRAILRREPDTEGLRVYLGRLRQGSLSKIDILGSLRFSHEGRQTGVGIHGLLMPWLLHTAYRVPLLGFLMALAGALLRPGKTIQRLRNLEANLDRLDHQCSSTEHRITRDRDGLVDSFRDYSIQSAGRLGQAELELKQLKLLADAKANEAELAVLQGKISHLQQGKADQSLLETLRVNLRNALESKADASEISALQLRLKQAMERIETRADQQAVVELQERVTETRVLVDTRADQQAITELQGQLRVMAESKAEKSDLTGLTNHLAELVQVKANIDEVAAVREQIQALASAKASNDALAEVRQTLDAKASNDALAEVRQTLQGTLDAKADHATLAALQQTLEAKAGAESLRPELADIRRQIQDHKRSILDQQRRLALLLEEARKRLPDPLDTEQLAAFSGEADHVLDAMYVSFEDDFRGTREDIKQRLSAYLPSLPPGVGSSFAPAVDLGCGRGEWLELLKEHDLTATGVDLNRIMAEFCREQELVVVEADALAYLREQPDHSLGLITGFHIIEHLPLRTLIALFDEALRVLKPGGMVIFETPNPENLVVGACNFYMDPTHRNPMPPMMTRFLIEARGFVRVEIRRMNQQVLNDPLRLLESGTPGAAELNPLIQMAKEHYFAAPDYAVMAYKA